MRPEHFGNVLQRCEGFSDLAPLMAGCYIHSMKNEPSLIKIYRDGQIAWQRIADGLTLDREEFAGAPTDRLPYAAWRKGFEEAKERSIRG